MFSVKALLDKAGEGGIIFSDQNAHKVSLTFHFSNSRQEPAGNRRLLCAPKALPSANGNAATGTCSATRSRFAPPTIIRRYSLERKDDPSFGSGEQGNTKIPVCARRHTAARRSDIAVKRSPARLRGCGRFLLLRGLCRWNPAGLAFPLQPGPLCAGHPAAGTPRYRVLFRRAGRVRRSQPHRV